MTFLRSPPARRRYRLVNCNVESRSRPVAVVVAADEFREFEAWRAQRKARRVGDAFAELRSLTARTGSRLRLPARKDRRNEFRGPAR